jgi:hypothetical protein
MAEATPPDGVVMSPHDKPPVQPPIEQSSAGLLDGLLSIVSEGWPTDNGYRYVRCRDALRAYFATNVAPIIVERDKPSTRVAELEAKLAAELAAELADAQKELALARECLSDNAAAHQSKLAVLAELSQIATATAKFRVGDYVRGKDGEFAGVITRFVDDRWVEIQTISVGVKVVPLIEDIERGNPITLIHRLLAQTASTARGAPVTEAAPDRPEWLVNLRPRMDYMGNIKAASSGPFVWIKIQGVWLDLNIRNDFPDIPCIQGGGIPTPEAAKLIIAEASKLENRT